MWFDKTCSKIRTNLENQEVNGQSINVVLQGKRERERERERERDKVR